MTDSASARASAARCERRGRRLDQDAHGLSTGRQLGGIVERRPAIETDQHADAVAAATSGNARTAAHRLARDARIARAGSLWRRLAALHHRVRHASAAGPITDVEAATRPAPGGAPTGRTRQRPSSAPGPPADALDEQFGDLDGFERRADRSHDVEQRVAAFDPPAQLGAETPAAGAPRSRPGAASDNSRGRRLAPRLLTAATA